MHIECVASGALAVCVGVVIVNRCVFGFFVMMTQVFLLPASRCASQGPGGTGCVPWAIESPAENSTFDHASSVSVSGTAPDSGINWLCRIRQEPPVGGEVIGAAEGTSTGTECDGAWTGSVSAEGGDGWVPRDNTSLTEMDGSVELVVNGNVEDSRTITFVNPNN